MGVVSSESRFIRSGQSIAMALGFEPELSSHALNWTKIGMYVWRGTVGDCAFSMFDEPVLVLHTGGATRVPMEMDRRPTDRPSRPGLFTLIPPGAAVTWHVDGDVHSYSLHLGSACFDGLFEASGKSLAGRLDFRCGAQDPLVAGMVDALANELARPSEFGALYVDSIADSLALHLLRNVTAREEQLPQGGLPRQALRAVLDMIEAQLEEGLSLQQLADGVGLSRAHFAKAFRQSMGVSPHRYITQRRVVAAKAMLTEASLPLCEIALRCGFASQAHFTEHFRRATGCTPSVYRCRS